MPIGGLVIKTLTGLVEPRNHARQIPELVGFGSGFYRIGRYYPRHAHTQGHSDLCVRVLGILVGGIPPISSGTIANRLPFSYPSTRVFGAAIRHWIACEIPGCRTCPTEQQQQERGT